MLSDSAEFRPSGARERIVAAVLRAALRILLKPALSPRVPITAQRRWLRQLARLNRPAGDVEIASGTAGGVAGEWLGRRAENANGAIFYLHGGGFCVGSPATHRALTSRLARAAGLPVFAADYRLAPEHPFPAALEDAISVYRALCEAGPVVLTGDSAGARLALTTALAAAERGLRPPTALVLFSPWIDLANVPDETRTEVMTGAAWLRACAKHFGSTAATPSPLRADLHALPPTLIQAGADELLCCDAVDLHNALEKAGVAVRCEIIPERWHAFQLHAGMLPSAGAAVARAAAFITHHSARPREGGHPGPRAGFPLSRE
jgi:monoterpene epsilon-lactone hydrolase